MFGIDDALIGAGVSLLGGLFGGGDDKKTTSQVNYKDMVKDAEEAGFNPLTAIRNGGSAGYTQTTTPGLSSGEFIADALKGVGQMISTYDPMAKATADLEYKIRQETLRNLQADTAQRLKASIGGVPVSSAKATKVKAIPDLYMPYRDNSSAGGGKTVWLPNPDIADIEQVPVAAGATVMREPQVGFENAIEAFKKPWVKVTPVPSVPPTGRDRYKPQSAGWFDGMSRYVPSFAIKWQ